MTSSNINKVNVSGSIINKVNVSSSISASSARGLTKLPESITAYVKITIGTKIPLSFNKPECIGGQSVSLYLTNDLEIEVPTGFQIEIGKNRFLVMPMPLNDISISHNTIIIPEGTKIIHPNVGLPQKLEEPLKVSLPDKFEAYLPAKTQIGQKNSDVLFELKEKFLVQILIKE
uniref:Uncharacterized protein n=1 Tax=viral metagenome TaxID=1070528 RepID=A0A6C0LPV0_9ZZZZ